MAVAYKDRFVRNGVALPNPEAVASDLWWRFMTEYMANNGQIHEDQIVSAAIADGYNPTNAKYEFRNWRKHFNI